MNWMLSFLSKLILNKILFASNVYLLYPEELLWEQQSSWWLDETSFMTTTRTNQHPSWLSPFMTWRFNFFIPLILFHAKNKHTSLINGNVWYVHTPHAGHAETFRHHRQQYRRLSVIHSVLILLFFLFTLQLFTIFLFTLFSFLQKLNCN